MTEPAATAPVAVVVLAAGEGTRMRSTTPKVLHGFAGRSLLGHVLAAAEPLGATSTVVVVGHARAAVTEHLAAIAPAAVTAVQEEQNGTGHAVRIALAQLPAQAGGTVLVLPADTPLLRAATLADLVAAHRAEGAAATMLTSLVGDPDGYGRVIRRADGGVERVVEHKDARPDELAVAEIAAGVYAFDAALLRDAIGRLSTDNAQGEEYLPDAIAVLRGDGHTIAAVPADEREVAGVNDRVQLAAAHRAYNHRLLEAHMRAGVTVIDPATTWVDATVTLERDAVLRPSVELHGRTTVGEGADIGPQTTLTDTRVGARSRLERVVAVDASVGADVTAGPFAYLRPGTALADGVHIGTYVEIKNSEIGTGSKVPHLSYVGDATVGEHSNIGAATVFVNYDGVEKHRSVIGSHARTGADNMFVAPVTVGDGAYTAAGSVITEDVPPGAMAVARAKQRNVEGWVARRRPGTAADHAARSALEAEEQS
ncbi:MAG: bifunctional UDP-N-acetylglucosamine pyrophosphorylase / glucosamine-phosphate N-acetyltransferase [Pseudonocardiales bacterium]|nr:bifunctional UDP-N-acetylglucosamine pyrophosphorylase / glucosamine-phosphate N-acetyltransferase [Pseudonocardiales bacterium]